MSASSTPTQPPKAMFSRLLTMKFMQRAAASSPKTPESPDEPSPKRRRTDSNASTPSKVNIDALTDSRAVQAALASEEAKREAVLEKQAAEAGDTRWVLSFEDQKLSAPSSPLTLRVIQAGFANIDSTASEIVLDGDDEEDKSVMVGRRSFGKFNKVIEKQQGPSFEESAESDSEEDEGEDESEESASDSDDPTGNLIKASRRGAAERAKSERKSKRRAEKLETEEVARKRRKNDVNLNGLTSLTGRQDRPLPPDVKCFNCGGNHLRRDCKEKKRPFDGQDDGPQRKNRRAY